MWTMAFCASSRTQSQSGIPSTFGDGKPASRQAFTTRSAIAPTWTLERPEATNIRSASVVLPKRSIETMSSALASSSPSTMICDKMSAVGAWPELAEPRAMGAAAGRGESISVAFLLARGRFSSRICKHATSAAAFQARPAAGRSRRQNHLADVLGALDPLMRPRRLSKGENRVDDRPAATRFQERPHLGAEGLGDDRLLRRRPRTQRRAGMDQALHHDRPQIDGRFLTLEERDLHDSPVQGRRRIVALDVVAADHVENDVGAPARGRLKRQGDEIVLAIVDAEGGAETLALRRLLVRSGGGDDARAESLGERDGGRADAGGSAMD